MPGGHNVVFSCPQAKSRFVSTFVFWSYFLRYVGKYKFLNSLFHTVGTQCLSVCGMVFTVYFKPKDHNIFKYANNSITYFPCSIRNIYQPMQSAKYVYEVDIDYVIFSRSFNTHQGHEVLSRLYLKQLDTK